MSKGVILTAAAVCGTAAFLWTLLAGSSHRDGPVVLAQSAPFGQRRTMPVPWPHDLEGLERAVKDNPTDFRAWFELAQRRHAAGKPEEDERTAWLMVVKLTFEETTRLPEG